jgi:phosphate transport system substrate-binding protein
VFGARLSWVALLGAALASGTCSRPSPPRESPPALLTLAGVEYLTPLLRAEVLAFGERYPTADSIRIESNGSALGMEQLVNGEVEMSLLMRELTDPEVEAAIQRNGLRVFPFAWDAVAVVVNPACPIEQISRTELASIYRGQLTDWARLGWKRGGEIIALTPGPKLGVFAYIEQSLLGGDAFAPSVYAPPSEQEVADVVAARMNAIACVSRPFADDRVRILRVSEARGLPYVQLDQETLLTRRYPLLRPISIATASKPRTSASDFITFASSIDGQRIAARHGYAPAAVPVKIVRTTEEGE